MVNNENVEGPSELAGSPSARLSSRRLHFFPSYLLMTFFFPVHIVINLFFSSIFPMILFSFLSQNV